MNYIPQLLHVSYGYDHGQAATLGGVAQGGSVIGLLVVGNMCYKSLSHSGKVAMVMALLLVCTGVPLALALGPAVLPRVAVVPLTVLWGMAYALPFYIPPGEFAMQVRTATRPRVRFKVRGRDKLSLRIFPPCVRLSSPPLLSSVGEAPSSRPLPCPLCTAQIGGKSATGLFSNLFDAAGFGVSAAWNPWASRLAKDGDFTTVLLSQALFGAVALIGMPLCMHRVGAKAKAKAKTKKA
jgi:hypothetical protein